MKTFVDHLRNQHEFSQKAFGPGERTEGVLKHIESEIEEVRQCKGEIVSEWIDIILLAMDGALRKGFTPTEIDSALESKLLKNTKRSWPDWKELTPDQLNNPINHIP
jgi:hypothetical protein